MTRRLDILIGAALVTIGMSVSGGWMFSIDALTTWSFEPNVTTKPNTAAGILLLGLARLCAGRARRSLFLSLPALVGGLTLLQYVLGVDLGIDNFLALEDTQAVDTSHPGRMSPGTALAFMSDAIGIWYWDRRREVVLACGYTLLTTSAFWCGLHIGGIWAAEIFDPSDVTWMAYPTLAAMLLSGVHMLSRGAAQ